MFGSFLFFFFSFSFILLFLIDRNSSSWSLDLRWSNGKMKLIINADKGRCPAPWLGRRFLSFLFLGGGNPHSRMVCVGPPKFQGNEVASI